MTNHLADQIRQINDWQDIPDDVRQYVTALAEYVERVGDQPAEVDASTELTVSFGLEPEQECRARAADIVWPGLAKGTPVSAALDEVDALAAYIRTGQRPT